MALGKGLGSLIPTRNTTANIKNQAQNAEINKIDLATNSEVAISKIKINPQQPRQHFDHQELEDLINSIKEHGIIQPLIVTENEDGYELIAGERRLRSAKIAGLKKVPVVIRKASDLEKLELALIENIQRSDLNAIEKAKGYQKLAEEFGLTQEEAAKKMGISRSAFANTLRLLNLPIEIQTALADNKISEGHAKIILSIPNPKQQKSFLTKITANKLSVRQLENIVESTVETKNKKSKKKISWQDPQIAAWQDDLSQNLATKVNIKKKAGGTGIIEIEYYSLSELKGIVGKITN